jgi:hypothetical protein
MMALGIRVGKKLAFIPDSVGAEARISEGDVLHLPVIVLYDEVMQSDMIQDFGTNTTFRDQLRVVLSEAAPWDTSHKYNIDNIEIFFENNITEPIDPSVKLVKSPKNYVRVELKDTLYDVLSNEYYIMPQFPVFTIIAKDSPMI